MLKALAFGGICAVVLVGPVFAARTTTTNGNNPNNPNNPNNTTGNKPNLQYPPPVDTSPGDEDRKKLAEARTAAAKAQAHVNEVVAKLKTEFESAPAHKAVVAAAQKAQAAYDAVREKTLASVHASADYQAAVAQRDQLAVQLASDTDDSNRPQIAQQRLEASKKLTAMELDALGADPQAVNAHEKLMQAGSKYAAQLQEFQQSIKGNSDWQAARTDLDKAKTDVAAAEKELAAEVAREADAQQQRDAQIAQINRQRLEQSGKGNRNMTPPAQ